jgi:hypothetical protein
MILEFFGNLAQAKERDSPQSSQRAQSPEGDRRITIHLVAREKRRRDAGATGWAAKSALSVCRNLHAVCESSRQLGLWGAGGEGFGAGLHGGDAAAAFWGTVDYLFYALHPFGEIHFAAKGFQVGLDLGPLEIHFLAGVVDESFGEGAVEDEGGEHVPVAEDLEDVGGLLVAAADGVDEVVG